MALLAAMSLALVAGCTSREDLPDLGQVSGRVTLDGQPVSNASVRFEPEMGHAATSFALSDTNGEYELYYTQGVKGAVPGKHIVYIQTMPGPPGEPAMALPAKYRTGQALTAEVTPGKNEINFELTSE